MSIIVSDVGEGISTNEIIKRVAFLLNDVSNVSWTEPELINWVNDAGFAIVKKLPSARTVREEKALDAGPLQSIKSGRAISLLDVIRNISDGTPVRVADRQLLDDQDPSWYASTQVAVINHYTFDERAPRDFYVYPPAIDGTVVEVLYSEAPPTVTLSTDPLGIPEQYIESAVNYVMYRALSKEIEEGAPGMAPAYFEAFLSSLDIEGGAQIAVSPNKASA